MRGKVWMSSMLNNYELGLKLGLRTKYFGENWEPPQHVTDVPNAQTMDAIKRHAKGICLQREELPEASAVFDEKCFAHTHDLFAVGGFYAVKGRLAEILSRFDLGEGGLIPFPIYEADLVTPNPGEFFLLNFGARKNSLLPEQCQDAQKWIVLRDSGQQLWKVNYLNEIGAVVLSPGALEGADLWFEVASHNKIFMSNALASALVEAGLAEDWRLVECKIVEAQS